MYIKYPPYSPVVTTNSVVPATRGCSVWDVVAADIAHSGVTGSGCKVTPGFGGCTSCGGGGGVSVEVVVDVEEVGAGEEVSVKVANVIDVEELNDSHCSQVNNCTTL
jgi:hypothetical protein